MSDDRRRALLAILLDAGDTRWDLSVDHHETPASQHPASVPEAEAEALVTRIEALFPGQGTDPCGLDTCPCCAEADAQAASRMETVGEAGRLRNRLATSDALLREALWIVAQWWSAVPGREHDGAWPRAEALLTDVKVCGCGAVYIGPEEWRALKYCGRQRMDGAGPDLELRDCGRCKSTLAREVA